MDNLSGIWVKYSSVFFISWFGCRSSGHEQVYMINRLSSVFPQFDSELIRHLASVGSLVNFEAEDQVMRPGQYIRSALLVLEGRIKLFREGEDGEEFFLYYLGPGEACALSMICAMRQETSALKATAVGRVEALAVPIEELDDLMRNHKTWYYFVLGSYRNRFEEVLELLDQVVFKSLDEKLEHYLKRQFRELGDRLPLTHYQIALDLNSSREVISRLLKKMENAGLISIHRQEIQRKSLSAAAV